MVYIFKYYQGRKSTLKCLAIFISFFFVFVACSKEDAKTTEKNKTKTESISSDYLKKFESVNVSDKVDPANPPQYLRVRLTADDGKPLTLFLVKESVRRDGFNVKVRLKGGEIRDVKPGPVRTYRGWCEELPDSMVSAYLTKSGDIGAMLLRALYTKGNGSRDGSGPGEFTSGKEKGRTIVDGAILKLAEKGKPADKFKFISGTPKFTYGKPYKGASFIQPDPKTAPFFAKTTVLDQTFRTKEGFFTGHEDEMNTAGYKKALMNFESTSMLFNLISLRDGNEAFRISNVFLIHPDPKLAANKRMVKRLGLPDKSSDSVCDVRYGGGGGAGGIKKLNRNKTFLSSANMFSHVMAHELGHLLNWGGDNQGAGVEGGLLGGGGNRFRYGTPAVKNRHRTRTNLMKNSEYASSVEYLALSELALPPYVACDQLKCKFNQSKAIDCLVNDFDTNGGKIAIASFEETSQKGGRIEFQAKAGPDGRDLLKYTPSPGYLGEDRFSYSIVNNDGRIGYGNVIISIGLPRRLLAHVSFDDVDQYNEYDLLSNNVDSDMFARVGVNWHKHRTKPFVAFWNVARDTGRGGYFDWVKAPLYNLNNKKERTKVWDHQEFTFDISGQPFLDSSIATYDLTLHRWGYTLPAWYWALTGRKNRATGKISPYNHPEVTLHKISLLVDGKVAAKVTVDKKIKLKKESPDRRTPFWRMKKMSMQNPRWIQMATGRYTTRFNIKNIKHPKVQELLKVAAAAKSYIMRVKNATKIPLDKIRKAAGPKVELRLEMSKPAGQFMGGMMFTPVEPALVKVKGKFGNCVKVHGFENITYEMLPDGNNYRSLSVWCHVPEWDVNKTPYLIKYPGRNGIRPVMTDDGLQMAYSDVHVGTEKKYFPLPPLNKWFHLAIVIGKDVRLYIDGKQVMQAKRIKLKRPGTGVLGWNINAAFDDLRVYGGALSQKDIVELMTGGKAEFIAPIDGGSNYSKGKLKWAPSAAAVKQKLYLSSTKGGLDSMKPTATLSSSATVYQASIKPNSNYYWRIDAVLQDGSTRKGVTWSFTTGEKIYTPAELKARKLAAAQVEKARLAEAVKARKEWLKKKKK